MSGVSCWAGHALSAQHFGTQSSVHHPYMNENIHYVDSPKRRAGVPPPEDVSAAWRMSAGAVTPCWPTKRDHVGFKPKSPWGRDTGFFYKERLADSECLPPAPAMSQSRSNLLETPGAPLSVSAKQPTWGMLNPYPVVDESKHPRWLTPRYLNLPSPNEERLMKLPQPWGPSLAGDSTQADGIAKRWPMIVGDGA